MEGLVNPSGRESSMIVMVMCVVSVVSVCSCPVPTCYCQERSLYTENCVLQSWSQVSVSGGGDCEMSCQARPGSPPGRHLARTALVPGPAGARSLHSLAPPTPLEHQWSHQPAISQDWDQRTQ